MEENVMLLDEYKESFHILDRTTTSDGEGGVIETWSNGAEIDLIVRHDTTILGQEAEREKNASTYTFLYTKGAVTFRLNDVVKRDSDGITFRITQPSGEDKTPSMSNLNLEKVVAERWELTS